MITPNQLFTQFGSGREGSWDEQVWFAFLRTLERHDGKPYTPSTNPELFEDLQHAQAQVGSSLKLVGSNERRSIFRAAPGAWSFTGVVEFDQVIRVTEKGYAVLKGDKTYIDCLRDMFVHYRERRNGKNPFRPLLTLLSDGEVHSFENLFESVQREISPAMSEWIGTSQTSGFPFQIKPDSGNPTRSVRHMLRLLRYAELVREVGKEKDDWQCVNLELTRDLLDELHRSEHVRSISHDELELSDLTETAAIYDEILSKGWQFAPWQVGAFCQAIRTKPFVILAGISGTGKTKLPRLVAEITGANHTVIPVRPDWRDSSDLLGYSDLNGVFHPGPLLRLAKDALENPEKQYFILLDEMNLAPVEYYFAEVLSQIEERYPDGSGSFRTGPLLSSAVRVGSQDEQEGVSWDEVYLPSNLALIGSVNMDETTHPFSRKVLDRAFVIEFSDVDLGGLGEGSGTVQEICPLNARAWRPTALRLTDHENADSTVVREVIDELVIVNEKLSTMQLQVGYRLRDEIALFVLNAQHDSNFDRDKPGTVDPVDLAICMKVLPRIQGGGLRTREMLTSLQEWAGPKDRPRMPLCSSRIELLLDRFDAEGFTSFWL